mmetsp:Transcript_100932/g.284755  ORF Transcript_100932/g.284755 Transcript_100932/m.284755 type:complete len:225 (-) Transcript_100932:236-910(-)
MLAVVGVCLEQHVLHVDVVNFRENPIVPKPLLARIAVGVDVVEPRAETLWGELGETEAWILLGRRFELRDVHLPFGRTREVVDLGLRHLGWHNLQRSHKRFEGFVPHIFRDAEIDELHPAVQSCNISGHEYILQLQIPVDYPLFVHVGETVQNLHEDVAGDALFEAPAGRDMFCELATLDNFHDEHFGVRVIRRPRAVDVDRSNEVRDVGMPADSFQDFELLVD